MEKVYEKYLKSPEISKTENENEVKQLINITTLIFRMCEN